MLLRTQPVRQLASVVVAADGACAAVDEGGWRRQGRQRKRSHVLGPLPTSVARPDMPPDLAGRCYNCLGFDHVSALSAPTRLSASAVVARGTWRGCAGPGVALPVTPPRRWTGARCRLRRGWALPHRRLLRPMRRPERSPGLPGLLAGLLVLPGLCVLGRPCWSGPARGLRRRSQWPLPPLCWWCGRRQCRFRWLHLCLPPAVDGLPLGAASLRPGWSFALSRGAWRLMLRSRPYAGVWWFQSLAQGRALRWRRCPGWSWHGGRLPRGALRLTASGRTVSCWCLILERLAMPSWLLVHGWSWVFLEVLAVESLPPTGGAEGSFPCSH